MNKYREPFRERGNIYDQDQPSKISYKHQLDPFSCPRQKQDLPEYLKTMDRKTANQPINISFNDNTKHTTSQMTTDDAIFRQKYGQKNANLYRVYENLFDERSQRVSQQQYKKNNAKHMEIESKISKIQSFHQKIENLLDMVKVGSKTPQRQRKQMGVSPSRSISKISTPISKGKTDRNKQQALEPFRPFRQQLRSRFTCQQINQKDTQRMKSQIHEPSENKNYQMQKQKDIYRITAKSQSELKYNQRDISRRNRDKSKQYMKTIEGEVKDIQNTIQILNQKIQKVDNLPFKRQIHFDDLSTSNPESLYLIREGSNFEKAFQNRRRTYDLSHQKKIHTQNLKHSQHQLDPKKNTKNTSDNLKVLGQESLLQREQNQASRGLRLKRYENSSNRRQGDYNHHLVPNVNPYDASIQPSEQENLNNGYNYKFKRNLQKGQSIRCARKE